MYKHRLTNYDRFRKKLINVNIVVMNDECCLIFLQKHL